MDYCPRQSTVSTFRAGPGKRRKWARDEPRRHGPVVAIAMFVAAASITLLLGFAAAATAASARYGASLPAQAAVNRGVVELETGRADGASVAIA